MAVIQSLMETNVVTVKPGDTVASAARVMAERELGAVLVVEGDTLRGIFSERDLVKRVVAAGLDPAATAVKDVMTRDPITVQKGTHVKEAARIVRENNFRHLPVVDSTRHPIGVISTRVFTRFVTEGLERFIDEALYKKSLEEGADPYEFLGGSYGK